MGWLARLFNRKKKEPGQGSGRKNKRPWQPWKWSKWKEEQAKQAEKPEESMSIDWGAVFGDEELEATPFGMMPKADKVNKALEEYDLKTQDMIEREDQREKARETLNRRTGLQWTKEEYDEYWDTFGDSTYNQEFGSDELIEAERIASDRGMDFDTFVNMVKDISNRASGQGWDQRRAQDELFKSVREWEQMDPWTDWESYV